VRWLGEVTRFAVERWQVTVLLFLLSLGLGVTSWLAIPRAEDPDFPVPVFTTVAVYPGATPGDVEQLVVDPLERRLRTLAQVKQLRSISRDGVGVVTVEFDVAVDAERTYEQVVREVNAARPGLPAGVTSVEVQRNENSDIVMFQLALVAPTSPWPAVDSVGRRVAEALERVSGVKGVKRHGAPPRELQVTLSLGRLAALGVTPGQLLQALGSDNTEIPAGSVDAGTRRYTVGTAGRYRTPEAVGGTVVAGGPGGVVRVRDLADVAWGDGEAVHLARYNGQRAQWITVTVQSGRNVSAVRDAVWRVLDRLEPELPAGITLARGFDQARNVEARLSRLGWDFAIAIGLVLLTLLPLGTRASLVVMVSIPLSLALAVAMLHATGFTINQLSIVGFVIALGLLVDDSIVVVENIARLQRGGMDRRRAAIEGTRQIGVAVLGATGTLVFAFVPLLFLPGLSGRYIRSLPMGVVTAVAASLLVSVTIVPWLASRLLPRTAEAHGNRALQWVEGVITRGYAPLLRGAMAHPGRTLALSAALVAGAVALVPVVGFSLFPPAGTPQFYVNVTTPEGSTLAETDRAVRFAEGVLRAHPAVAGVFANSGRDNPSVYYNVYERPESPVHGQLLVRLHPIAGPAQARLQDSLRTVLAGYAGAEVALEAFVNGPPIDAPIAMRLEGPDLDTLRALAARTARAMRAVPGTRLVRDPLRLSRTDLRVVVDRGKAGLLGVPSAEVERTLRLGIAGLEAGKVQAGDGEERPLVVRTAHGGRPGPEALARIQVASVTGAMVPLPQLVGTRLVASAAEIRHTDRQRSVTVTSGVLPGYNTNAVTQGVLAALDSLALPPGYALVPAGEIESREESFGGVGGAVLVAVFAILMILVLEFRDFRTTLVVASVIPLGVVGGVLALFLSGYTLSFTALIGFVALVGIEIKTSILLVDFTDQLRAEGVELREAVERAGAVRFLPIVLTTCTAIGGLLPLALQGSGLYSPLAWVIIGGLVSSTLIARLVTPVLYLKLAPRVAASAPVHMAGA
jgi:multidrug efflux pump subunit AcrB